MVVGAFYSNFFAIMKTILYKRRKLQKELLKRMTFSEHRLAKFLKSKRIKHSKQFIIAPYIVDFYLRNRGIIIELDGSVHNKNKQINHDVRRDNYFFSMKLIVLRFKNNHPVEDILNHIYQFKLLNNEEIRKNQNRIAKVNAMCNSKGYKNNLLNIINPNDWKIMFEEHKKQLRKKYKGKTSHV